MKLIIFDIDGTLTDTKQVDDACFMQAFENIFGINIQNQKWENLKNITDWGITEEIILQRENRIPSKNEYRKIKNNFIDLISEKRKIAPELFQEIKGASSFFNQLKKRNDIALGIATGGWEETALIKLNAIGISINDYPFSNSNYFKTREEITLNCIRQAEKKYQHRFEDIIYFGDGKWDYLTCKKLGIQFIGIDNVGNGKLKSWGSKIVFQDFTQPENINNHL